MEWCSRLEIRHNSLEKGIFVSICCDDESNKVNARATIKRIVLFVSYESFLFCTAKLWKEDEKALNEAWKLSVKGEGIIENENRVHKNSLQFLLTKSETATNDCTESVIISSTSPCSQDIS